MKLKARCWKASTWMQLGLSLKLLDILPMTDCSKKLDENTLKYRRENGQLCIFHIFFHNNAPAFLTNHLPKNINTFTRYPLRDGMNLRVKYCYSNLFKNSFFNSAISKWNNLSVHVRDIASHDAFKKKYC